MLRSVSSPSTLSRVALRSTSRPRSSAQSSPPSSAQSSPPSSMPPSPRGSPKISQKESTSDSIFPTENSLGGLLPCHNLSQLDSSMTNSADSPMSSLPPSPVS